MISKRTWQEQNICWMTSRHTFYNMSETDWGRFKDRRYLCELKQELADKCVEAGNDLSSHDSASSYDKG